MVGGGGISKYFFSVVIFFYFAHYILFLKTYCKGDGCQERMRTSTVNEEIKNKLMQIGIHAGFGVSEGIRYAKDLNPAVNKKDVFQI